MNTGRALFLFNYAPRYHAKMKKISILLILSFLLLISTQEVFAGFGITPPYVRNEALARNTHYEQKIILVRGDPVEDLKAKVTIDVPGANDWISIDKGSEFILPKGESQFPIVVSVNVPGGADFRTYKGNIRIVLDSAVGPTPGTVGIALGAQVDVRFNVVDQQIIDFKIREVEIADLEEGHTFLWLYFPGKINFTMQLENLGNIPIAPSSVQFDIYDAKGVNMLESVRSTNSIKKVSPFTIGTVTAELPTRLKPGSYRAIYRIYKTPDEVVSQGGLTVSVLPYGTLPGYKGYGFAGLSLRDKSSVVLVIGAATLFVLYALFRLLRLKRFFSLEWVRSLRRKRKE